MLIDTEKLTTPIIVIVVLILAASIAYAGYNYGHANIPTTPTVVTVTPTPTPTFSIYTTNTVEIVTLTTGAGFPQANVADGRAFEISYSDYDRLRLHDRVQFTVTGTFKPYNDIVYQASNVYIVSRAWDRYCYDEWSCHNRWEDRNWEYRDDVTIRTDNHRSW